MPEQNNTEPGEDLGIKRMLRLTGALTLDDFDGDETVGMLLDTAGRLDENDSFNGSVYFEGEDGQVYSATREIVISKVDPETAREMLAGAVT